MTKQEKHDMACEHLRLAREVCKDEEKEAARRKKLSDAQTARRNFRTLARYMLEAPLVDEDDALEELRSHGFDQGDYQAAVFWGQLKKAINGADTEAAKYVRDSAGFKPTESMQVGNMDDLPFQQLNLSELSNEQLLQLIAKRQDADEQ